MNEFRVVAEGDVPVVPAPPKPIQEMPCGLCGHVWQEGEDSQWEIIGWRPGAFFMRECDDENTLWWFMRCPACKAEERPGRLKLPKTELCWEAVQGE